MKIKNILLCTALLTLNACESYEGRDAYELRYTPRQSNLPLSYVCMQGRVYSLEGCKDELPLVVAEPVKPGPKPILPIVSSYTILFNFDKADLRVSENVTLERVVSEINKYKPSQVTVTGYTDSSGPADYNHLLSNRREQAVSKALRKYGIANQTLKHEARGEYDQAVKTADGVKNQENRRVVIDFRR